jgi:Protein of unknown function (DUF3795)
MGQDNLKLLAACGLYCGACYHYRASFYDRDRLQKEAARRGRDSVGFTCQGCRSGALYIHAGCAHCEIRACADRRGLFHCGLCTDFPCEQLCTFQSDDRVHHREVFSELVRLRERGAEAWLAAQAELWRCVCGESYSWYEENCHACGEPLASYGADPTVFWPGKNVVK